MERLCPCLYMLKVTYLGLAICHVNLSLSFFVKESLSVTQIYQAECFIRVH